MGLILLIDTIKEDGELPKFKFKSSKEVKVAIMKSPTEKESATAIIEQPLSTEKDNVGATGFCEGKDVILMIQGGDSEAAASSCTLSTT